MVVLGDAPGGADRVWQQHSVGIAAMQCPESPVSALVPFRHVGVGPVVDELEIALRMTPVPSNVA